jgi:hypothetical protein
MRVAVYALSGGYASLADSYHTYGALSMRFA